MYIKKIFEFSAAHNLIDYQGKCENLHGHNYKLEILLSGKLKDDGMVIDFVELKKIVKKAIIEELDHKYLNDIISQPTAENIILWIWERLKAVLEKKWILKKKSICKREHSPISTNQQLKKIEQIKREISILKRGLWRGYYTYEVRILQKYLKELWYYKWPITWYYDDATVKAVSDFQIDKWIMSSTDSFASGWFGPKTRQVFKNLVMTKLIRERKYN